MEAADEGHISFALREGRVIFTEDDDFLRLAARGIPHAGIVYCPQQSRSVGEIISALLLLWEVYEPSEMHGRVEYF